MHSPSQQFGEAKPCVKVRLRLRRKLRWSTSGRATSPQRSQAASNCGAIFKSDPQILVSGHQRLVDGRGKLSGVVRDGKGRPWYGGLRRRSYFAHSSMEQASTSPQGLAWSTNVFWNIYSYSAWLTAATRHLTNMLLSSICSTQWIPFHASPVSGLQRQYSLGQRRGRLQACRTTCELTTDNWRSADASKSVLSDPFVHALAGGYAAERLVLTSVRLRIFCETPPVVSTVADKLPQQQAWPHQMQGLPCRRVNELVSSCNPSMSARGPH